MKEKNWKNFIENLIDFFRGGRKVKHSKKKFDYSKFFREDNDLPVMPPYSRF